MCATLPAAAVLGVRAMRRPRGGDGSEPALGMLALGVAWLSFLLAYPSMRTIVPGGLPVWSPLPERAHLRCCRPSAVADGPPGDGIIDR